MRRRRDGKADQADASAANRCAVAVIAWLFRTAGVDQVGSHLIDADPRLLGLVTCVAVLEGLTRVLNWRQLLQSMQAIRSGYGRSLGTCSFALRPAACAPGDTDLRIASALQVAVVQSSLVVLVLAKMIALTGAAFGADAPTALASALVVAFIATSVFLFCGGVAFATWRGSIPTQIDSGVREGV